MRTLLGWMVVALCVAAAPACSLLVGTDELQTAASGASGRSASSGAVGSSSPDADGPGDGDVPVEPNGAATDRMLFWVGAWEILDFSDADLDAWRARGVGGFVMMTQFLHGYGGEQRFTADPAASFDAADGRSGAEWSLQRKIRTSDIVARGQARGMKMFIGHYTENYWNGRTPFVEWFDHDAWTEYLEADGGPAQLWGGASWMGFDGIAWDTEPYQTSEGVASWRWAYADNSEDEASTRAQVKERGAAIMARIVEVFPAAELLVYLSSDSYFPDGWNEDEVQPNAWGVSPDGQADDVSIDFWNGMTSAAGYGDITFLDAVFYKTVHVPHATWDAAMQYNANRWYALFSRSWDRWDLASRKVQVNPFLWIDNGSTSFEAPMSVETATAAIASARRWGLGQFANYQHHFTKDPVFDYAPYQEAMQQVAVGSGGYVDTTPPTISGVSKARDGDQVTLAGEAAHSMGIRSVRWSIEGSASGAFPMTWVIDSGDHTSMYVGHVTWSGTVVAPPGALVTITAETIKGQTQGLVVEM